MAPAAARVGFDRVVRSLCFVALLATLALAAPGARAQNASPVPAPALPTDPARPCPAPASLQDAPPPGPGAPVYDYAIVIDVSGSMNGDFNLDGTPDPLAANGEPMPADRIIFQKVKSAVAQFVAAVPPGANVAIIPFGTGVDPGRERVFTLDAPSRLDEARTYIDGLRATDGFTHITEAVQAALAQLTALRAADPNRDHYQTILLYTDGQGNGVDDTVNGAPSVDKLLASIDAYKTSQPFLFVKYVGLGVDVPDKEQLEADGVQVVQEASGQVSPIRELRLAIVGGDLGELRPGDAAASRVCVVAGDLGGKPRLTFALDRGDLPDGVDLHLDTQSKFADAAGVPLRWTLARGEAPADYAAWLDVATDDKEIVLVPARLPVQFTVLPPPPTVTPTLAPTVTPTPVPPTPTPEPTSTPTPAPTAAPTATPLPTATPTATPVPTNTPIPTPTPIPPTPTLVPTSTPIPTPTPSVILQPPVPLDFGTQDVNTTSDPQTPVEWRVDLPVELANGATASLRFGPELEPSLDHESMFQLGATPPRPEVALDGRESSVSAIIRMPAGPLQQMGAGEHEIGGHLVVDAGDAAFPLPDVQRSDDGTWDVPIKLRANVFTPLPWGTIAAVAAGLAALAVAGSLAWMQRPVLPSAARIDQYGVASDIGGRKSASVGGTLDDVDVGARGTIGRVQGRWGRKARFVADPAANDVSVMGTSLSPGASSHLSDGDAIRSGGVEFTYHDSKLDGGANGDGAGNVM